MLGAAVVVEKIDIKSRQQGSGKLNSFFLHILLFFLNLSSAAPTYVLAPLSDIPAGEILNFHFRWHTVCSSTYRQQTGVPL